MIKIISCNIAQREKAWRSVLASDADMALLQEARKPPADIADNIKVDSAPWYTTSERFRCPWRTAVVGLSGPFELEWFEPKSIDVAHSGEFAVSRQGTLAAATVTPPSGESFIVVSLYASWERPHSATGSSWIYADASVHRLISDLSVFIGRQKGHSILAAGDLNILHGHGEGGSAYWAARYGTVFSRMEALGLRFVGPQAPNGHQADPWPDELPRTSKNVPTYHSVKQTSKTATRQLDFVFASDGFAEQVHTRALNDPDSWGPSDHCCVEIEIV